MKISKPSKIGILVILCLTVLIWGINFPEAENYKLLQNGKTSILVIDSLTAIKKDQSLKTKLWNALKAVFVK